MKRVTDIKAILVAMAKSNVVSITACYGGGESSSEQVTFC